MRSKATRVGGLRDGNHRRTRNANSNEHTAEEELILLVFFLLVSKVKKKLLITPLTDHLKGPPPHYRNGEPTVEGEEGNKTKMEKVKGRCRYHIEINQMLTNS